MKPTAWTLASLLVLTLLVAALRPAPAEAPTANPMVLMKGTFAGHGSHDVEGTATIYRLDDGARLLRLTDFASDNGPDLKVYLVSAADGVSAEAAVEEGTYLSLGALKGNKGNQNYMLPEDADLDAYESVSIWCERFGVNFGTAALAAP